MAADAGRLRNLLQQAQNLISDLKGLPLDADTNAAAYPRVFELARLVNRFMTVVGALPSGDSAQEAQRASWLQRAAWLQEDAVSLAQERVWSSDSQAMSSNLLKLLSAGAQACDTVLREKAEKELALSAAHQHIQQLQAQLTELQHIKAQHDEEAAQSRDARSQVVVLRAQLQESTERLQRMDVELAAAREQLTQLSAQLHEAREEADSRVQVIQALMQQAEQQGRSVVGVEEVARLKTECSTLRSSADANAQVVAKLIELNTELMENYNAIVAQVKGKGASSDVPGAVQGGGSAADGAVGPQPLQGQGFQGQGMHGSQTESGGPGVGTQGAVVVGQAGPGPPHAVAAAQSSLADAFALFLSDGR